MEGEGEGQGQGECRASLSRPVEAVEAPSVVVEEQEVEEGLVFDNGRKFQKRGEWGMIDLTAAFKRAFCMSGPSRTSIRD